MLWSVMSLIFKTSSMTPSFLCFFCAFNIILSFSTYSQSSKKICTSELLGANVIKQVRCSPCITDTSSRLILQQNRCRKTFEVSATAISLSYLTIFFFFKKNALLRREMSTFGTAHHRSNHLISVCQLYQYLGTLN